MCLYLLSLFLPRYVCAFLFIYFYLILFIFIYFNGLLFLARHDMRLFFSHPRRVFLFHFLATALCVSFRNTSRTPPVGRRARLFIDHRTSMSLVGRVFVFVFVFYFCPALRVFSFHGYRVVSLVGTTACSRLSGPPRVSATGYLNFL